MTKRGGDYRDLPGFEVKELPTFIKAMDEDLGIVDHFIAVMGNVDKGSDRILPGAFGKTIAERGRRVKVLDQHRTDSALRVVGKPLDLREVGREALTPEILEYAPDATGGLLAKTQYAIETDNGRNMFKLVKGGFLPESSFGYDALQYEYKDEDGPQGKRKVRELKEIRLWEYSNVIWGMNPATAVVAAKADESLSDDTDKAVIGASAITPTETVWSCTCPKCDHEWQSDTQCSESTCPECGHELGGRSAGTGTVGRSIVSLASDAGPEEGKPWRAIREGDKWRVYKLDEDGEPTGEPLGEHDTQGEAAAQVRALYANEPEADKTATKEGRVLAARNATRIANALARLIEVLEDAGVDIPGYGTDEEEEKSDPPATDAGDDIDKAPAEAAAEAPEQAATDEEETDEQAAPPDGTRTSEELLKLIDVEQDEIAVLLEV